MHEPYYIGGGQFVCRKKECGKLFSYTENDKIMRENLAVDKIPEWQIPLKKKKTPWWDDPNEHDRVIAQPTVVLVKRQSGEVYDAKSALGEHGVKAEKATLTKKQQEAKAENADLFSFV